MVNPILARLVQAAEAEKRGEWAGHAVPGVLRPVSAVANAIGLAQEPFTDASRAAFGLMMAANAKVNPALLLNPDSQGADMAQDALRAFEQTDGNIYQKARAANEAAASGGKLRAFTTGVGAEGFNPLNYVGGIGRAGTALEAAGKAPLLARALKAAALGGEGVNRASILPLYLSRGGLERLVARPEWLEDAGKLAAPAARQAAPALADLLQTGEARQAAKEATTMNVTPLRTKLGGMPQNLIPKIGGARQYGPGLPPEIPLPPATIPPRGISTKLADRVAAAVGDRGPMLPRETVPAMGPLPLPKPREAVLADRMAQLFPKAAPAAEAATEAAPEVVPSAVRALPTRQAPDLGNLIAGRFGPPKGAVTAAEERAAGDLLPTGIMPEFGGVADRAALGALAPNEIDTLVDLAYPHENALNNAMAKYTDDAALAGAAWDRVTKDPNLLRQLVSIDEPLARKLALLPERAGAELADATPGQLDELIAETTAAAKPNGRQAFDDLIASRDSGKMGAYLPNAQFFAKRLGIPLEEAQGYIDELVQNGTVGDFMGDLAFKPKASTIADKVADLPRGGDIAAGGGGMGLLPYPGGINGPVARAIERGSLAGIGGAVLGAGAGAATDDDDRVGGALKGALYGSAAGFGLGAGSVATPEIARAAGEVTNAIGRKFDDTMLDADLWADAIKAGWARQQAAAGNAGVKGAKQGWDAFWAQWRSQVVNTLKQLPQDALTRKFTNWGTGVAKEFGIANPDAGLRQWQGILRRERAAGATSLQNPVVAKFRALGQDKLVPDFQEIYGVDMGTALDVERGAEFGGVGRAVAGAAIGLGAGVKRANPLIAATGAVRGYYAPFVDGMVRFMNGIQHDAQRFMLGDAALDRDIPRVAGAFLDELAARGVDVTALRARGGFFAPDEVAAIAGKQAGQEWDTLVQATIRKQGDRIAFLAGDFRDKLAKDYKGTVTAGDRALSTFEKGVGKAVPFARWQIRYAPVLAEVARNHPRATALAIGTSVRGAQQAEAEGLKGYQAGTIPLTDETPLVGPLVRARLGGQKGTVRLNPLGAVMPFGADTLAGEDLPEDATGYQRFTNAAGRIGFQANPVIQSLAYVTGQDYKAPGALSRTSGLEGTADMAPILIRAALHQSGRDDLAALVPDLSVPSGRALLDAGRELLSPVTGAGVTDSDPETRRYAELVLQRTGKPLSDPSNRAYAERVGDMEDPLWQTAILQARMMGAAGNAVGMVSPVSTTAQTEEAANAQAAGKLPMSDFEISQLPRSEQRAAQSVNDRLIALNPAIATYRNISTKARKRQLLDEWEARNARMKQLAPRLYAERRKQYEASLP